MTTNRSRMGSTLFLTEAATKGHAGAYSETAQSLVGRPRVAWELATGASAVAGEPPVVGQNPQGTIGVDLSGPPFGACMLLPVSMWRGRTVRTVQPVHPWDNIDSLTPRTVTNWRIFNRFHAVREDGNSPLQKLMWSIRVNRIDGSGTTVMGWVIDNRTTGVRTTGTINHTTSGLVAVNLGLVGFVGGINDFSVKFFRASGTRVLQMHSVLCAVAVKRRHGLTFPG